MTGFGGELLVALLVEVTLRGGEELVRQLWRSRADSPVEKAIADTVIHLQNDPEIHGELVADALTRWCRSDVFDEICQRAFAGERLSDAQLIDGFVASTDCIAISDELIERDDENEIRKVATRIVETFLRKLKAAFLRTTHGHEILYGRIEQGLGESRTHFEDLRELVQSEASATRHHMASLLAGAQEVSTPSTPQTVEEKSLAAQLAIVATLIEGRSFSAAETVLESLQEAVDSTAISSGLKARYLSQRGAATLGLGNNDAAAKFFLTAAEEQPESPQVLTNAATVSLVMGELDEALRFAKAALASGDLHDQANAVRLTVLGHRPSDELANALLADPSTFNYPRSTVAVAQVMYDAGEFLAAECLCARAEELGEDDHNFLALWGSSIVRGWQEILDTGGKPSRVGDSRPALIQAESLFSKALEILQRGDRGSQFADILSNRATARVMMNQTNEALEDLDLALSEDPNRPMILVNRGLIHFERGDNQRAIADFEAALALGHQDENLNVVVARAYFQAEELHRAEELARRLYEKSLDADVRLAAAETLIRTLLAQGRIDVGKEIVGDLQHMGGPDAARICAFYFEETNDGALALRVLEEALEHVPGHQEATDLLSDYGLLAGRQRHWSVAANALAWVTDAATMSVTTKMLAHALYESGRWLEALTLVREVRKVHGPQLVITEIEARILEAVGSLGSARECLVELAAHHERPDLVFEIGRLSFLMNDVSRAVDVVEALSPEQIWHDATLLMAMGQFRKELGLEGALEFAFRALRLAYDDPRMHLAFVAITLREPSAAEPLSSPVALDSAVTLTRSEESLTFTLLDDDLVSSARNELSPSSDLFKLLIGKEVGDLVFLGNHQHPYKVIQIATKFAAAHLDALKKLETHFPTQSGVQAFDVGSGDLSPLVEVLEDRAQAVKSILAAYSAHALPLGVVSHQLGVRPYELWRGLTTVAGEGLIAVRPVDVDEEDSALSGRTGVVLDLTTMFALDQAGLLDVFLETFPDTICSKLAYYELVADVQERRRTPDGRRSIGSGNGSLFVSEQSAEDLRAEIGRLEHLALVMERGRLRNADPIAMLEVEDFSRATRVLGMWGLEAAILARDLALPLVTDDLGLRVVAQNDFDIAGVSVHGILKEMLRRESIGKPDFAKAKSRLLLMRVLAIPFSAVEVAIAPILPNVSSADVPPLFQRVLRGGPDDRAAAFVTKVLHVLGMFPALEFRRQWLVDAAISGFLSDRDLSVAPRALIHVLTEVDSDESEFLVARVCLVAANLRGAQKHA